MADDLDVGVPEDAGVPADDRMGLPADVWQAIKEKGYHEKDGATTYISPFTGKPTTSLSNVDAPGPNRPVLRQGLGLPQAPGDAAPAPAPAPDANGPQPAAPPAAEPAPERPWTPVKDFKPTRWQEQAMLIDALPAGDKRRQLPTEVMARAIQDRKAQELGLPGDPMPDSDRMQALWNEAARQSGGDRKLFNAIYTASVEDARRTASRLMEAAQIRHLEMTMPPKPMTENQRLEHEEKRGKVAELQQKARHAEDEHFRKDFEEVHKLLTKKGLVVKGVAQPDKPPSVAEVMGHISERDMAISRAKGPQGEIQAIRKLYPDGDKAPLSVQKRFFELTHPGGDFRKYLSERDPQQFGGDRGLGTQGE